MRVARAVWVANAVLLAAAMPGFAHHSFKAEYDTEQPVTLKGKITKVTWTNPHVTVFMDVKGEASKITNWQLELSSPNMLLSQGWTVSSLKAGDRIVVEGFKARNRANLASAKKVTLEP